MTLPNINSTLKNVASNLSQVISVTNALGTTLGTTIAVIRANLTTLNTKIASVGMVYLGSVSVSGTTLIDTTILATSNASYRSFELVVKNIIGTVANKDYLLQWHSGGAFRTTAYSSSAVFSQGVTVNPIAFTTGILVGFTDTAQPGSSGVVTVSGLAGSALKNTVCHAASSISGSYYEISATGVWNSTSAVDGFQIVADDGNALSSGSVDIYGIL